MVADHGTLPLRGVTACRSACAEKIIDEHDAMTDETVVADRYQFTDKAVRLDLHPVANRYILLYFCKGADEAVMTDGATIQVHRRYDPDVFAEGDINDFGSMDSWLVHRLFWRRYKPIFKERSGKGGQLTEGSTHPCHAELVEA